jgi:sugar lactone lactonase YvrE
MAGRRSIAALVAVVVGMVGVACGDDDDGDAESLEWPPRVAPDELVEVTGSGAGEELDDGVPVADVDLRFVPGMGFDAAEDRVVIATTDPAVVFGVDGGGRVDVLIDDRTELPETRFEPAGSDRLSEPGDVAVGPDGTVYFVESARSAVRAADPDGEVRTAVGTGERAGTVLPIEGPLDVGLDIPTSVATGSDGTLYVADSPQGEGIGRVWAVSPDGDDVTQLFGEDGTMGRGLARLPAIAVDGSRLWVVDGGTDVPSEVTLVDLDTGEARAVPFATPLPSQLSNLVVVDGVAYATAAGEEVWRLTADGDAEEIVTPAELGGGPTSATALTSDGERLYIAGAGLWAFGL